ncbi:hypothetical protein E0L36_10575 [Streptomyces sp. AJS327]|nr:hypothetical protein [Streptomyces sp. AJS327]
MTTAPRREAGQALPIYITVVAGLLFLAFAFFAVGQAAASRNSAQGAADAAALAAAQEARDHLKEDLLRDILDPDNWDDIGKGQRLGTASGCAAAERLAARNDAQLYDTDNDGSACQREPYGRPDGFTVEVRTNEPVGRSVIPGTEKEYAEASATALITFECEITPDPENGGDTPGPGDGDGDGDGDDKGDGDEGEGEKDDEDDEDDKDKEKPGGTLKCGDKDWVIDPDEQDLFPDVADLFSVTLSD